MFVLYHVSPRAILERMTWDQIFAEDELQKIAEYDTLEEAEEASMCYDSDNIHIALEDRR